MGKVKKKVKEMARSAGKEKRYSSEYPCPEKRREMILPDGCPSDPFKQMRWDNNSLVRTG
jgi:hypothetical protein